MADEELLAALRSRVRGSVEARVPLARHTSLRVGGPAAALVRVDDAQDLAAVAEVCASHRRRWLILGRGSNVLVADTGWPGVVVTLGRAFRGVHVDGEDVEAGAAEAMPALAVAVARAGLGGLAFGVAIPGSLGGAVRMNAGAHGRQLCEVLLWADAARLADGGAVTRLSREELAMGYRHTALPDDAVVVRAGLRLVRADAAALEADMAEMRAWRRRNQPLDEPSCGSVFRNPRGDSAGRLVEAAGMKGHGVGGARVSEKHANFIITTGAGATAADVHAVINDVQRAVAEASGVELVAEVVLVGFDGERVST